METIIETKLTEQDFADLQYAKSLLENPGLAAKLTNLLGTPIEKGFEMLPRKYGVVIELASKKSLEKALQFAVLTLGSKSPKRSQEIFHKIAVATSGATGGAFGLSAIPMELPVSTIIMLRSIADIARSEGEDLDDPEVKLNCLQVFALGGKTIKDDAAETGYYAIRLSLSKLITDAANFIAERGLTKESAPALVKFISTVAARFGTVVSEKVAAMAVPAIGAVGGALINVIFINHFQNMAKGHFIIRRLERKYGSEVIKNIYQKDI